MKELLYLKDDQLKEFIEKISMSYRETFSDAKKVLDKHSIGVAHHKVINLISLYEGITVSELQKKLKITKQSLNRVLKDLIKLDAISFKKDDSILKLDLNKPENERNTMYQEFESVLGLDEEILGLNNIIKSIKIAKENEKIKGIELKCDFPLTGWAQTRTIREALKDFKNSGKFIYAYSDVFTQKGYYLASIADTIILAGNVGLEKAIKKGGSKVKVQ